MMLKSNFKFNFLNIFSLFFALLLSSVLSATEVGHIEGQFSVDPQGNATYQLPIQVQPGVNGVQPGVSLAYSSRGGNGHLGVGWSLSGMSTITRCAKTFALDGVASTVNYTTGDAGDRYCLDGQRLMGHGAGAYGSSGKQYRTYTESFVRVTSNGSVNGAPAEFIVEDKSGVKKYYGQRPGNTSARIALTKSNTAVVTHQWMLSRIEDRYLNRVDFNYWSDAVSGEYRISDIVYGNGSGQNAGKVAFVYDTIRTDKTYGYGQGGTKLSMTNRLNRIDVYGTTAAGSATALARRYNLTYEYGTITKLSHLKAVTQCNSVGGCLAPTTFDWEHGLRKHGSRMDIRDIDGHSFKFLDFFGDGSANDLIEAHENSFGYNVGGMHYTEVADIDGDGRQDFLYTLGSGLNLLTSKSGSTVSRKLNYRSYAQEGQITAVDLTQDGLPEILLRFNGKLQVYMNTPAGLALTPINTGFTINGDQEMIPIEFDGDGVPEIFVSRDDCSPPPPPPPPDDDPPCSNCGPPGGPQIPITAPDTGPGNSGNAPGQANDHANGNNGQGHGVSSSDPTADEPISLAALNSTGSNHCWDTAGILKWTGNDFKVVSTSPKKEAKHIRWLDVNGDGLTEYVTHAVYTTYVYGYLNKGGSLSLSSTISTSMPVVAFERAVVLDYNRDGKQDFAWLYRTPRHWEMYQSTGLGTFLLQSVDDADLPTNGDFDFGGFTTLMDYNGDGMPDTQFFEDDTWEDSDDRDIYLRLNTGTKSGQLAGINNGIGQVTQIGYAPMTTSLYKGHESKTTSNTVQGSQGFDGNSLLTSLPSYPVSNFIAPMDLVSSFIISNGLGGKIVTEYGYEGAKVAQDGRGFLGFSHIRSHNLNTKTVTENYYRQDRHYAGMVVKSEQWKPHQTAAANVIADEPPVPPDYCAFRDTCGTYQIPSIVPIGDTEDTSTSPAQAYLHRKNEDYRRAERRDAANRSLRGPRSNDENEANEETVSSFLSTATTNSIWSGTLNASGSQVSETLNTFSQKTSSQGRPYPYVLKSTETHFIYKTVTRYKQVINDFVYNNWGCATNTTTTTNNGAGGDVHKTQSANTYANYTGNWNLCKLTASTVTHTRANYGASNAVPLSDTRTSTFTYDSSKGHILTEIVEPNIADQKVTKTYEYDTRGNRKKETLSGSGFTTRSSTTAYDTLGLFPLSTSNALGHTESFTWDYRLGVRLSQTGVNGLTATTQYDDFGRAIKAITPRTAKYVSTEFAWCTGKGLSPAIACADTRSVYRVAEKDSAAGNRIVKTTEYDMLGRSIHTTALTLNGAYSHQQVTYDAIGREYFTSAPYFVGTGEKVCWSYVRYDNLNRKTHESMAKDDSVCTTSTTPVGYGTGAKISFFTYNGLVSTATDPQGRKVESTSNVVGRLRNVREWDDAGAVVQTNYDYDAQGNTTWVQDANGNITRMEYDKRGHKTKMIDPDMSEPDPTDPDKGVWTYTYNARGELLTQTDAKGQKVTMTYDVLGRMKTRTETEALTGTEGTTTWYYDNSDLGSSVNYHGVKTTGKLTRVVAPGGYDKRYIYENTYGSLYVQYEYIDSLWRRTDYLYDDYGRKTYTIYPSSHATNYWDGTYRQYAYNDYNTYGFNYRVRSYDRANAIWVMAWQAKNVNPSGKVTEELLSNGVTEFHSYDLATGYQNDALVVDTSNTIFLEHTYNWDLAGNLLARADHKNAEREDFTYDKLYRLKTTDYRNSASQGVAIDRTDTHSYDKIGNLLQKGDQYTAYTYGVKPHAVASVQTPAGERSYLYDANGNMTSVSGGGGNRTVVWNSFNKPYSINKDANNNSQFFYGPDRARYRQNSLKKTVINSTKSITEKTHTIYVSNLYEKKTITITTVENGVTTTDSKIEHHAYIYANGRAVAIAKSFGHVTAGFTPKLEFLHRDHLGSVSAISSATGALLESSSYDAWGKRRPSLNWNLSTPAVFTSSSLTQRGYTGHEMLDNVGLIHMNGRVYDPEIGRFLSADVFIQFPESTQGFNRYTYVNNNPLSYNDPSGHFISLIIAAVIKYGGYSGWTAFWGAVAGAAVDGYMQTGSLDGAVRSGLMAAVSAGVSFGVGSAFGDVGMFTTKSFAKALVHGATQGGVSKAFGGDFKSSFIGGAVSSSLEGLTDSVGAKHGPGAAVAVAAITGGAASAAVPGGSFKQGAMSAAFVEMFGQAGTKPEKPVDVNVDTAKEVLTESPLANPTKINNKNGDTADGRFGSDFRKNKDGTPKPHNGVDLSASEGDKVRATGDGIAKIAADNVKGYGSVVYITHSGDVKTRYAHLESGSQTVINGQAVKAGDTIGRVGRTGNLEQLAQTHLHYEIRVNGSPIDPAKVHGFKQ